MAITRITYPVTALVRETLAIYPSIANAVDPLSGPGSELELVRLLDNTHYNGISTLLSFVDKWLDQSQAIGRRLVREKHIFPFENQLSELYAFAHLRERLGSSVTAVSPSGSIEHDIDVGRSEHIVRIEVYSPRDTFGFLLAERYLWSICKYIDVNCGFDLKVRWELKSPKSTFNPRDMYYPYDFPGEDVVHEWLRGIQGKVSSWLDTRPAQGTRLVIDGPMDSISAIFGLNKLNDKIADRSITFSSPSHSTDIKLFFRVKNLADRAKSSVGLRLADKLRRQQCGTAERDVLRLLVVNFSYTNCGWRDFINQDWFQSNFRELMMHYDDGKKHYDLVLPCHLSDESCFGSAVILNPAIEGLATDFVQTAQLDIECVPNLQPAPDDLRDVL